MEDSINKTVLDKTAFSVTATFAQADAQDDRYWWSQTCEARLQHVEYLRRINYGDQATAGLQRSIEIIKRS